MDYSKIHTQADAMAKAAKNGTLKINDTVYTLRFTPDWQYEITDESGEILMRYNTKKLSTARQWLRDHFAN